MGIARELSQSRTQNSVILCQIIERDVPPCCLRQTDLNPRWWKAWISQHG